MIRYIKCPRCELNYIDADRQEYCDVCIAEMKGSRLQFADLDDDDYGTLDEELEDAKLCPICGINRLRPGETMCEECRAKQEYEGEDDSPTSEEEEPDEDELDPDHEDEWQRYLDDTDDSDLAVADEKIKQELEAEFGGDDDEDFKDDYIEEGAEDDESPDEDEEYDPYLDGELGDEDEDDDDEDDDDDDSDSDDDF